MKVLITGGAGFIGSHTVDLLLQRGYSVRIIDSLEPPVHQKREKPAYINDEVEFIIGNVCNRNDVERALSGIDIVFHLAAHQGYLPDFSRFANVNDVGTTLLYEVIVNNKLPIRKLILGSSQAVYGEGKYKCSEHGIQYPYPRSIEQLQRGEWEIQCPVCRQVMIPVPTDESIVNPHNQYSISKYCQELYALNLGRRHNIPTTVLRYSITQGSRQSFYNAYSGILRIFTTRLLNNQPPVIYEDGKQLRDYVYVGDVARANLLVIEEKSTDFKVYNVGGNEYISVLEYAEILNKIVKSNTSPEIKGEFRFGDTRHIISDSSKLKRLGWQPRVFMPQMIREYLEWAQVQPKINDYYAEAATEMRNRGVIKEIKTGVI